MLSILGPGAQAQAQPQPVQQQQHAPPQQHDFADNAGLVAARAAQHTLRAGGWRIGSRPVGGGFLDQRAAASNVQKFSSLAAVYRGATAASAPRRRSRPSRRPRAKHAAAATSPLERSVLVELDARERLLQQMRKPRPPSRAQLRALQTPPQEDSEQLAKQRAEIRKEEMYAVTRHGRDKAQSIRRAHKMKKADAFDSLEEFEKYSRIQREALPKLELRMKALAAAHPELDPADSNNPGAARAALMAAAYGDAVDDWESQVTEVQGRMSKILSSTIDERALAASRESLGGKSPEGGAEKSRAVRCFSASLATRPGTFC